MTDIIFDVLDTSGNFIMIVDGYSLTTCSNCTTIHDRNGKVVAVIPIECIVVRSDAYETV